MSDPFNWRALAACRGVDPALFFPERGWDPGPAVACCAACPVTAECLEDNIWEIDGIWGGTTGRQRRRLRRDMAAAGTLPPRPTSAPVVKPKPAEQPPCGTPAGYRWHRVNGGPGTACTPCLNANAAAVAATRARKAS